MVQTVWKKTLSDEKFKIFVGWDSREDIAFQVCKTSIEKLSSIPVSIIPLKQKNLREGGNYWRGIDPLATTEFTFTRFLVPHLTDFSGWALFIDCDFLFVEDIKYLIDQIDNKYAVMCVHHDYTPKEGIKMDGKQQTVYPRKNWSSMVLFNCGHPSNKKLTKELVNNETTTGAYLHRFSWLKDNEIGKISHEWNWLVGWYNEPNDGKPKAIHYTEGGPWFKNYYDCEYSSEWYQIEREYLRKEILDKELEERRKVTTVNNLTLNNGTKSLLKNYENYLIDPLGTYYGITKENVIQGMNDATKENKVAAIFNDDIGPETYKKHNIVYDEYLEAFVKGVGGYLSSFEEELNTNIPLVIRGLAKSGQLAYNHCKETGRTFYSIDSGYLGNERSKSKIYHRITKNDLQYLGPIVNRSFDRAQSAGYKFTPFTKGRKILICPPSNKVMKLFNQPDAETWTNNVIQELKKYTDRPIEVRLKPLRSERISTNTIEAALKDDVHCLVTYNSIAATESLINGKPAIALGPNAAHILCNSKLSDIEHPNIPTKDEMIAFVSHLAYCQFTKKEMMSGYAFSILEENH